MGKSFWPMAVCAAVVCATLGCDGGGGSVEEPVLIGTITSLNGDLSSLGPNWRDSVKLAVHEANAAGGLLTGRQIKLLVEDDRTSSDGGAAAAQSLIDAGVVGIIGAPASSSTLAAVALSGPAHLPQISGTSTSASLNADEAEGHDYFFRTVPDDDLQGFVLGSAAAGEYNNADLDLDCLRLAIINIDNPYGNPFGDAIAERFGELGRSVVADVDYAEGLTTYTSDVETLIAATPDCIAIVAYPDTGGIIVREWYSLGGPTVQWIGTDGIMNDFMNDIPVEAAVGFLGTSPASDPVRPQFQDFDFLYNATFGEAPQVFADAIYDATALLILAIVQAGSTDGDAVRDALLQVSSAPGEAFGPNQLQLAMSALLSGIEINYEGAAGPVDFDFYGNGDVVGRYEVWMYDGDTFQSVAAATAQQILDAMGG